MKVAKVEVTYTQFNARMGAEAPAAAIMEVSVEGDEAAAEQEAKAVVEAAQKATNVTAKFLEWLEGGN